ncbi:MAG: HAMP domain-containing histidine kinase [Verrucomicrobia bacterium]|nr:HAMP domain-containing histidine kinase [Verrucomicrobiota bacterium]
MRERCLSRAGVGRGRCWLPVLALLAWSWSPLAAANASLSAAPLLTNAQQVLDLGLERSRAGNIPVRLRGVMTYQAVHRPEWFYLQDDSAAVLIIVSNQPPAMVSGQLIEVDGVAAAGIWAPFVGGRAVRVMGMAPLPAPKRTPPAQLALGADFGHWVEVEATVRDVAVSKNRLLLLCAEKGLLFQVWSAHREELPLPLDLLDARVQLQGVPWVDVGYERRPFGFKLHQPGTNCIRVLTSGRAAIFERPSCAVQSLRQFAGDRNARVKVTGVVTLHSPAGWLCLQDGTGGLFARQLAVLPRDDDPRGRFLERDQPQLQPGDRIELVGAPLDDRPFAPTMDDAEFRLLGHTPPRTPRALSTTELKSGRHDAELVSLKARVVDVERHDTGDFFEQKVWLQSAECTFEALLDTRENKSLAVRQNDFVAVSGVCRVQPGQFQQVRSFSLHLRGPGDLVVTRPPSWWSLRWVAWLLAGGGVVVLTGLIAITLLRRQVARRTVELSDANARLVEQVAGRQRAEEELRAALAAEKDLNQLKSNFVSMVSHEFRTPLGAIQSSAELLQNYFDRLTSERRARLLQAIVASTGDMARIMEDVLLLSQVETARYEFQPRRLSLDELCQRLADETTSATQGRCPIQLRLGPLPELSWCDEGLLRHVFNNLLSNAVKYSLAGAPVEFRAEQVDREVVFTVQDRGLGIPTEDQARLFQAFARGSNVGHTPGTGLGLVIVQRCVTLHGGTVSLDSTPDVGTTVTVRLPLLSENESDTSLLRRWRERVPTTST